jgi:protein O-GlcNAc transferase
MVMVTISEALATAKGLHQAGRLSDAEPIYRQIIEAQPGCAEAWHLLGGVAYQTGRVEFAIQCVQRSIALQPAVAPAHHDLGLILQEAGRWEEAAAHYRRAIELKPNFAEAHNNLGNVFKDRGKLSEAADHFRRAIEANPSFAEAYNNLGAVNHMQGRPDTAAELYRRALELQPQFAEAHSNLGAALKDQGLLEEAAACQRRALDLNPSYAPASMNLGTVLQAQEKIADAIGCYRRAIELMPSVAEGHFNLGTALQQSGQGDAALASYRRAIELRADYAEAFTNLGNLLKECGALREAAECHAQAVRLKPQFVEGHLNLGTALKEQGLLDEALAAYRRVLELKPDLAATYSAVGSLLKDQGKAPEAINWYRRAMELKPGLVPAHSNLIYALPFCPGYDAAAIFEECRRWNERHAARLTAAALPHANDRTPDRRLRVGYVSPDFRDHCQSFFTLPLLSHHDHSEFEIFCYADVPRPDQITERVKSHADVWQPVASIGDAQLAELIREDQIDILVDLTMHMAGSRLLMFARKPAPVQFCWLAYPGTTGLTAIDYRLTDPQLDPPGMFDRYYSEESIRLPETFWCYDPLTYEPQVNALPAMNSGNTTFGSLNNFCKVNADVLKLWARVLLAVERSRLMLLTEEGSHREATLEIFQREGIGRERIMFVTPRPRSEYLKLYHQIDIGLDTLPYNGHTTSLDALWMGVPVVTLVGQTVVGRAGLSQLTNVGLSELVAHSEEEFVKIAASLAGDLPRLSKLRGEVRERMAHSPLMDAPRFARNVEAAYRAAWKLWCGPA